MSSFLEPEFYASRSDTIKDIQSHISAVDPIFAAKAAIFSRTEYGMRSTSHLAAAEIAKNVKGQRWTKDFFNKVVYRVDDASEIMAAYLAMYGKPIPNSLKKGLALGLSKFNRYQLAKYKGNGKGVKLVDLFNLVHPKPSESNAEAFKDLMEGKLASEDTWEAMISEAGQNCKNEQEKQTKKKAAWKELVTTKKIGYFALLKNLRNILETEDNETITAACAMLVDKKLIQKSLVLPFRYLTAMKELSSGVSSNVRKVLAAVNKAVEISLENVPVFDGETLVAIDMSGSMGSASDSKTPAQIASLFGAVLAKSNNADILMFDTKAKYLNVNLSDSVGTITEKIQAAFNGGGTNFKLIFDHANKKYDRIIILSDMQAWVSTPYCGGWGIDYGVSTNTPNQIYGEYCAKFKAQPKVYCFDLKGYGSAQFPQEHVYSLSGFSEKVMDIMKVLENDPQAFINQIKAIKLEGE